MGACAPDGSKPPGGKPPGGEVVAAPLPWTITVPVDRFRRLYQTGLQFLSCHGRREDCMLRGFDNGGRAVCHVLRGGTR
jgi:hypothetical protein